jgi:hypothetical protein
VPVSVQASGATKRRWKAEVTKAAMVAWGVGVDPLVDKVQIHVTCYHDSALPLDVDNMLKPIQDALCGVVYVDDSQLTDTHGHLRDINEPYRVKGMTPARADGFVSNGPFVHIRIEAAPAGGELP